MKRIPVRMMVTILATMLLAMAANAQDVNCNDPQSQFELNECSARDLQEADKALNAVWKVARAAMKRADGFQPKEYKGAAQALLDGQRGWIKYRDGQCAAERFEVAGGTMAPMVGNFCLARMTRARTEELKQLSTER